MSISSASELESSSLINFARSLHFTDRERIKEREDGKRSCRGGGIIRGRRLFKYFRQREAINRGTAIIRENEVKRFSLSLDL